MDALDAKLIELLTNHPGLPVMECARRLRVARATVQGRLDKLHASGVITGVLPVLDAGAMGFGTLALCDIEIDQQVGHARAAEQLAQVPEVVDLYTVTGGADMHARIVARSTDDLQRVLDEISQLTGVARTSSQIALRKHFTGRLLPLVRAALAS